MWIFKNTHPTHPSAPDDFTQPLLPTQLGSELSPGARSRVHHAFCLFQSRMRSITDRNLDLARYMFHELHCAACDAIDAADEPITSTSLYLRDSKPARRAFRILKELCVLELLEFAESNDWTIHSASERSMVEEYLQIEAFLHGISDWSLCYETCSFFGGVSNWDKAEETCHGDSIFIYNIFALLLLFLGLRFFFLEGPTKCARRKKYSHLGTGSGSEHISPTKCANF
jgi:hypothetical protein